MTTAAGLAGPPGSSPLRTLLEDPRARRIAPFAAAALMALAALVVPGRGLGGAAVATGVPSSPLTPTDPAALAPPAGAPTPPAVALPAPAVPPVSDEPSFSAAPPATSPSSPPPTSIAVGPSSEPTPVAGSRTVRASGWASAGPASPLDGGVAEGSLPVGRAGPQDEKRSFVQLDGTGPTLELAVVEDATATYFADRGVVAICPVTTAGWTPEPGMSFDEAPEFDAARCVDGTAGEGVWTFDLSSFDEAASANGFALVPSERSSGPVFRITLRAT